MPRVTAIIATYNAEKWIHSCIESLNAAPEIHQILIVDNNSTDKTLEKIRECFENVEIISNPKNEGFGIANNIGIKSALNSKAEYVFLLNQDAKIEPSTIRTLIHSSVENPSFGVLAPIAFNYDGTGLDPHCINYLCNNSCNYLSDLVTNRSSSVYELPFYPAAAWLVSASALKQIGGFDPLFFMYGEDFDFAQRARRAGFKVGLVPHAKYFHHRGPKPTRANHTYWEYVVWLKGTDSPFLKSLANIWRESFLRILRALAYFDLKMAREVLEALIDIHKQLRTIKKHRELCKSGTGVFLER